MSPKSNVSPGTSTVTPALVLTAIGAALVVLLLGSVVSARAEVGGMMAWILPVVLAVVAFVAVYAIGKSKRDRGEIGEQSSEN
jgi:fucose permease